MKHDFRKIAATVKRERTGASSLLLLIIVMLISALVYWSAITEIDKVTRGQGKTMSADENQLVQSAESGVLVKRYVEEGDIVTYGDILFDIDPIDARTQYEQALKRAERLEVQHHRLLSESQNITPQFTKFKEDSLIDLIENEQRLFDSRKSDLQSSIQILDQRLIQKENRINELFSEVESAKRIAGLLGQEIETISPLVSSGLAPETRLLTLLRENEKNKNIILTAKFSVSRLEAELNEIREQMKAEEQRYVTSALGELSRVDDELSETLILIPSLAARLARTSIHSPTDGIINQINFRTENAYVRSGEVLLEIVPTGKSLVIDAEVDPKDIADVLLGDKVKISLTAYDPTRYGRMDGTVEKISADAITDKNDGRAYYSVKVSINSKLFEDDDREVMILPGMVATIDVLSGKRTILDYVWQPIARTKDRALRD
jgi:membrane fusion protein, adhesin transport system